MPQKGASTIRKTTEAVQFLLDDYPDSLRALNDSVLVGSTIILGAIRGGAQINIVPHYCEIEVDRHTLRVKTTPRFWRNWRIRRA
jgi:acetylornithine deacetylase/succinyl-diaminopimelate desuccinylase-like protein